MTVSPVPPVACRASVSGSNAIHSCHATATLAGADSDGGHLARVLTDEAAMVLLCPAYDESRVDCRDCRDIASLRLRSAQAMRAPSPADTAPAVIRKIQEKT